MQIAQCLHLQESLDNTVVGGFLFGTEIGGWGEQLKILPGIYFPTAEPSKFEILVVKIDISKHCRLAGHQKTLISANIDYL